MKDTVIKDVTKENIEDLCQFCMLPTKRDDPYWIRDADDKMK